MSKVVNTVSRILEPMLAEMDLLLYDIEYVKEADNWALRVFIDNEEEKVSLERCEELSKKLSKELDRINPIDRAYILEVSSPGLERPLKTLEHYRRFKGRKIRIKTYGSIDGKKVLEGKLMEADKDKIKIEIEEEEIIIPFNKIASGKLVFDFNARLAGE